MSKVKINSGSGTQVSINSGQPGNVTINKDLVPVQIEDHLYGASASVTQSTDTLQTPSRYGAELYGFKHNIQLTAFVNGYNNNFSDLSEYQDTGKVKVACYIPTDRWKHPVTGTIGLITDYDDAVWSAAGASLFGTTAGAAKAVRYPNHGQELYDLTVGDLGWDYVNGLPGANDGDELYGMMDTIQSYFVTKIGRKVATGAYRNGQTGGSYMLMKHLLGARNSNLNFTDLTGTIYSNYGQSKRGPFLLGLPQAANARQTRINSVCGTRLYDQSTPTGYETGTTAENLAFLNTQLLAIINNGGYYLDFTHWHATTNADFMNAVCGQINTTIGSSFVFRGSYNEIVEYLFLRDMVSSVSANVVGSTIVVDVVLADPYNSTYAGIDTSLLLDLITVPISVRIDTTNTDLAGSEITSSNGTIRKISANVFILNIPFGGVEGTVTATVSATGSPSYLNFDLPEITSSSNNGTTLEVNTDVATKAVLFKVTTGGLERESEVHARSSTSGTTHSFNVSSLSGFDLRVGIISTATNQSILSGII